MQVLFRILVACCVLCSAAPAFALPLPTVTVMADHSLSIAVSQLAREYSRTHQVIVNTSFAPQKTQAQQITEGGAADILITPNTVWINDLKLQGLVDVYSQKLIARNQLALVGPAASTMVARIVDKFPTVPIIQESGGEPIFLVGNPESLMEGVYAKEALRNLNAADDLGEYTLYVKRLDQMFEMVAKGQAYGLFYYTSALGHSDVKVIDVIPESTHKPIDYMAVVIAGDNMNEARKFLQYLVSEPAKKLLEKNGFLMN